MWQLNSLRKQFIEKVEIFVKDDFFYLVYNKKFLVFPVFLYNTKQGKALFFRLTQGVFKQIKFLKTYRSIFKRNLQGLSRFFYEVLLLKGIGFRASISDFKLCLELGFSHTVFLKIPKNLKVFCPTKTTIFVTGTSLQAVKEFCSLIQRQKPVDPYKGKGIFFRTKEFRTKAFKK